MKLSLRAFARPPWHGVLSAADRGAEKLEQMFLSAIRVGVQSLDEPGLIHALASLDTRSAEAIVIQATTNATLLIEVKVPELVRNILAAGGEAAAKVVRRTGRFARVGRPLADLHFDLVNPRAVEWARRYSADLVKDVTEETRRAIRRAIVRAFTQGIPTRQVAKIIRNSIGLQEKQLEAVFNLRQAIIDNPGGKVWAGRTAIRIPQVVTEAFIQEKTEAYAGRLLTQRARLIARTGAISASNEGQRQLWMQAVDKGFLRGDELRVWIVTGDRRLCPQCESSQGDLAPINEPFPNGTMGPPLHPACRCTTGLSRRRGTVSIKNRRAA